MTFWSRFAEWWQRSTYDLWPCERMSDVWRAAQPDAEPFVGVTWQGDKVEHR